MRKHIGEKPYNCNHCDKAYDENHKSFKLLNAPSFGGRCFNLKRNLWNFSWFDWYLLHLWELKKSYKYWIVMLFDMFDHFEVSSQRVPGAFLASCWSKGPLNYPYHYQFKISYKNQGKFFLYQSHSYATILYIS